MKSAHLPQHLSTKHQCHVVKPPEFFKRKLSDFRSSQATMREVSTTSAKALKASKAVSFLVAKAKKQFTLAVDLLPAAAIVLAMLDKIALDKLKTEPLSNDTACHKMDTMGTDIVDQAVGKLGK